MKNGMDFSPLKAFIVWPRTLICYIRMKALLKALYPRVSDAPLVRFGPEGDGGYLLPDDLDDIRTCFSPGVCEVSGFEVACAERGLNVFMADASVDDAPDEHELFHFRKKFIGSTTQGDFITLSEWVDASVADDGEDLLLQMDIEGYEYDVFLSSSEELIKRFRIIVVELHGLQGLLKKPFSNKYKALKKLLKSHRCVHIHPNNCHGVYTYREIEVPPVMEFTFVRNDRLNKTKFQRSFPNSLDFENTSLPPLVLPECWYASE